MTTATLEETKRASLYYRDGRSDKEYHVTLEPKGGGYVVNIAYGRRGSTLSTGTKTTSPVYYDAALILFDKVVNEKKAKGYTEGENSTPYQHLDGRVSGLLPQLLNPVDEREVVRLLDDRDWCLQEKKDGRRLLLRKTGSAVEGINRKGLIVGLPQDLITSADQLPGTFVLDGECVGETLHAFDLLILDGADLRAQPYRERFVALLNLIAGGLARHIQIVQTLTDPLDKATWLKTFKDQNAEGIVLKHWLAPYVAGRPNSGGAQLKHKFVATLSAVVAKVNTQRSVSLKLLNHEGWNTVGNVTIPANHKVPGVGTVVEVRYLYAYPDGSLFQPVYLGERSDIGRHECVMSQLKLKRDEEDEP
jgi:bifunctional non-homologous end joining protein LigD